jgi:hypothetical protein
MVILWDWQLVNQTVNPWDSPSVYPLDWMSVIRLGLQMVNQWDAPLVYPSDLMSVKPLGAMSVNLSDLM